MNRLLPFFIIQLYAISLFAQKPPLDTSAFNKWALVTGAAISNDGKYTLYYIKNQPPGSSTLVLQAIGRNWKREIPGGKKAAFTHDSRKVVCMIPGDSLCLLTLGSTTVEYFPRVRSFALSSKGKSDWQLALSGRDTIWQYKPGMKKMLVLANRQSLGIGDSLQLDSALIFTNEGNTMLCRLKGKNALRTSQDGIQVDVWSYSDAKLQSQQLKGKGAQRYTAAIGLDGQQQISTAAVVLDSSQPQETGTDLRPLGVDSCPPIKARDAAVYIVQRMSVGESPNYYYTTNFKNFTPLTDIHPEKDWNWLHAESHTWKALDGSSLQGILYKPENFEPSKKYPLIFYCGEKMSEGGNRYLIPAPADGRMNIPWFVSNGYLVFTPDIYYKIGDPGQSIYNAVISAADYLSKYPWVDSSKMGLQGFELGAYAVNYLVTHTNRFAAACSASGVCDLISIYGALDENGASQYPRIEGYPYRLGATLWENPDLYIKNSPIFDADKVTTPLLTMHNKKDEIVPFAQGVEFFTGLRRLGKTAWMLQYDDGDHTVWGPSAVDFSIRVGQFFDHYLKNAPAPVWMIKGIPARMKGIVTGLELDR